ncbi:Glu-tRNA(Gln) amidotransferase GatDE subunit D, partial [Candidatus Woesearchaeota archaeon]|nr:Glu-tRNA(Gln) amidotransferase GatDE subunit D [Candidatus Woesearchaeota archaeon]
MKEPSIGDLAKVFGKEFTYTGIIMPSKDEDIVILKLENGYNVGVSKSKI